MCVERGRAKDERGHNALLCKTILVKETRDRTRVTRSAHYRVWADTPGTPLKPTPGTPLNAPPWTRSGHIHDTVTHGEERAHICSHLEGGMGGRVAAVPLSQCVCEAHRCVYGHV